MQIAWRSRFATCSYLRYIPRDPLKTFRLSIFRIFKSEFFFWLILALIVSIVPITDMISYGTSETLRHMTLSDRYFLLASCIIVLGVYMFQQIFGAYPLRSIRIGLMRRKEFRRLVYIEQHSVPSTEVEREKASIEHAKPVQQPTQEATKPNQQTEDFRLKNIHESARIAEKLFSRSGIYLMVGCIIAFSGVFIFYNSGAVTMDSTKVAPVNIGQELLALLPRFGSLFFIEFIAIFFLKQYRIVLEEYRYYELAKRKRQEEYDTFALMEKHQSNKDLLEILKAKYLSAETSNVLKKDETTQMIEVQKLANQETEVFTKLIDLVKLVKEK